MRRVGAARLPSATTESSRAGSVDGRRVGADDAARFAGVAAATGAHPTTDRSLPVTRSA
jgi:hypothetical protein